MTIRNVNNIASYITNRTLPHPSLSRDGTSTATDYTPKDIFDMPEKADVLAQQTIHHTPIS